MTEFVLLIKLTSDGAKANLEVVPKVIAEMRTAIENLYGAVRVLVTLGDYDIVAMGSLPGDEELAWLTAHLTAGSDVAVTTLKGFTSEQWASIQDEVIPGGPSAHPFGH
jgi:uncharacterized protein with GYD domain